LRHNALRPGPCCGAAWQTNATRFSGAGRLHKSWGGPPDRGRRPRRPARTLQDAYPICSRCGTKASRADQGVCPTTSAALPTVEKRVALAWQAARDPEGTPFTGATGGLETRRTQRVPLPACPT
jgi:hypothetical protein